MFEIRQMKIEDISRVMEIERDCFPVPWSESAYITEISNSSACYVVACLDNVVVGYAGMWVIMDEIHITTIGVDKNHRRKYFGEKLLTAILDEGLRRGSKRATLEVRQSNKKAQELYNKYGFNAVAIRRGYYTDNSENAIIMWIDDMLSDEYTQKYNELKRISSEIKDSFEGVA